MKNFLIEKTKLEDIYILRYDYFLDQRGYFTEHFRMDDFKKISFLQDFTILQANESFSQKGTIRGLHFQWEPYMGKLVRVLNGKIIDLVVDIRLNSPNYGKIIGIELVHNQSTIQGEWVWVPPGFAHGCLFLEDSTIEYFCTGQYSEGKEASISPLTNDLDWSLCDNKYYLLYQQIIKNPDLKITNKDRYGYNIKSWKLNINSQKFIYNKLYHHKKILVTGGSGLLGQELQNLILDAEYPSSYDFNITNEKQMDQYLSSQSISTIIHCAAMAKPTIIEKDPISCIIPNIEGTAKLTRLCAKHQIKLIYISTDYVFKGDKGNYSEEDQIFPINKYAWSKLGGECCVRLYDNHLIVRLSFGPNTFPYTKAFTDQFTSRESVANIARKISNLLKYPNLKGTIHVGSNRKSVYDYSQELGALNVQPISIKDIDLPLPTDTSLNSNKYNLLISKL